MHDPLVVAFTIRRPWPRKSGLPASQNGKRWAVRLHHDHHDDCPADCPRQPFPWWKPRSYSSFWRLAGREFYWAPLITVWHREPGGRDALTVCRRRYQDKDGGWHFSRGWHWHVHHWKIQVHPAQAFRRWMLTRCEWCHGRSVKGDRVNFSRSWDTPRSRWWRGERGLYHRDCSGIADAHAACVCTEPVPEHGNYGKCWRCGKFRPYGRTPEQIAHLRDLAATVPAGQRPAGDICRDGAES